jgi:flagellar basal-body rod modification protein FlgD
MNVNAVQAGRQAQTAQTNSAAGGRGLERDSFMKLLLLQLRSQDPMSPMDSSQMFSQMAQLTTLEQLWDIRDLLSSSSASQQIAQGSALLGRHVEANSISAGRVSGLVEQVRMVSGTVWLQVGSSEVRMDELISVQ